MKRPAKLAALALVALAVTAGTVPRHVDSVQYNYTAKAGTDTTFIFTQSRGNAFWMLAPLQAGGRLTMYVYLADGDTASDAQFAISSVAKAFDSPQFSSAIDSIRCEDTQANGSGPYSLWCTLVKY